MANQITYLEHLLSIKYSKQPVKRIRLTFVQIKELTDILLFTYEPSTISVTASM